MSTRGESGAESSKMPCSRKYPGLSPPLGASSSGPLHRLSKGDHTRGTGFWHQDAAKTRRGLTVELLCMVDVQ
eukprot:4223983-Amphidinium_carterae.2